MSLQTLNDNLDIIGSLVIPSLEEDLDNIQKLDDEPNDVGGLTAAELKAEFDKSGNLIKAYLNGVLLPALSDTVAEAEARATAERERVANENIRTSNENTRIENEDARQENETARVNAEKARADAESARKTAESQRATAESTRESQESTRKSNETARQSAESTRQTQESARQTAENARETKESARQSAESGRASAEQTRQGQESTRQSQEATRQTNEQTRQSNEQARKAAETQREVNEQNRKDSFVEEIDQAKSWAVGGTGKRPGEDTNNAKYWSEQAKANVGGDFATNARVDEVEEEVDRVAQSVTDLETQVEQDVGQAIGALEKKVVPSDWSQNDTSAPGYVKNRTHWSEIKMDTVVPEQTASNGDEIDVAGSAALFDGKELLVILDGVVYQEPFWTGPFGESCWGDSRMMFGSESPSNSPFMLLYYIDDSPSGEGEYLQCLFRDKSTPHTIAVKVVTGTAYHPLSINLGGTGASEANQARQNLGAAAVKEMTKAEYDALPAIDPTIFYALTDVEADGVKIEVGSYVGTGTYGEENQNTLNFGFSPRIVYIYVYVSSKPNYANPQGYYAKVVETFFYPSEYGTNAEVKDANTGYFIQAVWGDKTLNWWAQNQSSTSAGSYVSAAKQYNSSGTTYRYIAIG